jgi:hypothetical protein
VRQHARSADCRRLNCIGEPGDALDGVIGNHHSKFGTIDARNKPGERANQQDRQETALEGNAASYGSGYAINAGTVAWRKSSTDRGTRPVRFVTVVVTIA